MCVNGLLVVGTNSIQKIIWLMFDSMQFPVPHSSLPFIPENPNPSLPLTRVNLLKREAGHVTSFELGHVASFETKSSLVEEAEHWLPSSRNLKELFVKKIHNLLKNF